MFNTVILLTGPAEQAPLAALLKKYNSRLAVHIVNTLATLNAIEPHRLRHARLIGFVTPVIVPKPILDRLGFGAYNFHPGSPDYPGWLPSLFATYDGARRFGATAHVMAERVDSGPIVGIELSAVPPAPDVLALESLAYTALIRLFWRLAPQLATQATLLPELPIAWSGRKSSRKLCAAMCDIPPDISKAELERRLRVFGAGRCGFSPTITLHGYRFRYIPAEAETEAAPELAPA